MADFMGCIERSSLKKSNKSINVKFSLKATIIQKKRWEFENRILGEPPSGQ